MIPNKKSVYYKEAKYSILEQGDIMKQGDEYYNSIFDNWLPIEEEFIGQEWYSDESKPVRRKCEVELTKEEMEGIIDDGNRENSHFDYLNR